MWKVAYGNENNGIIEMVWGNNPTTYQVYIDGQQVAVFYNYPMAYNLYCSLMGFNNPLNIEAELDELLADIA